MPDILLEIADISGNSKITGYIENHILCSSFGFGANQPIDYSQNSIRTPGTTRVSNLSLTRFVDVASVQLMAKMFAAHTWPVTTLRFLKATGAKDEARSEFLTIEMENTIIADISCSGSGPGEQMHETLTLNFTKITFTYKTQDEESEFAGSVTASWDLLAKNSK